MLLFLNRVVDYSFIHNIIQMGQGQSRSDSEVSNLELLKKMMFVLTEHSKNFSEISVYRMTQKPYDYYMRFRETVIDSEHSRKNIATKKELYKSFESIRCLVRVQASEIKCVIELCSNTLEFDSYARYHNYTLEDAIDCKLNREKHFKEADLFYIMINLLQVGEKLNNILGKTYKGLFKVYKVYLSTEGYVKLYPFQLMAIAGPNLIRFQEDSTTNSQVQEVEFNMTPKKGGEEERSKNYKDDLKDLAVLIIQLILLNKKEDLGSPRKEQLQFCLDRQVSQGLKLLLLGLLTNKNDFTYQSVTQQLQVIKQRQKIRPSYCIRLEEDISLRQSEIMKKQEDEIFSQKEQQLRRLSSINQNLVPTKIQLVYKRGSFGNP